ncbi:MAG: glycosyltransferase family 4 protein [bacterium]
MSKYLNKIKVLHIDLENGWRGGQKQALYLLERELQSGINSHFFCRENSEIHKILFKNNYPHSAIKYKNEFDLLSAYKIAKYAKNNSCNIINCHSSHSLSIGLLSKFFYSKPKLIGVRRVDFKISGNFLSKWKYNSHKVDKIVCVSEAIKNVMKPYIKNKNKLFAIHSGVDTEKYLNYNSESLKSELGVENKIVVGTIAAFADHKDYPTLIKSAKEILDRRSNIVFVAVGDGELLKQMKNLVKELAIGQNFIFTGFRTDIGELLNLFDIFVLSSKEEGLGTSILDAMSVGLPIAATKAGGIPEIVNDKVNGILCNIGDCQSLSEAILELANDEQLRKSYGDNSKELVKEFSIEVTTQKYLDLYKQLLGKN